MAAERESSKFGIQCYLASDPTLRGKIRSTPSDFIVKEITTNGEVVDSCYKIATDRDMSLKLDSQSPSPSRHIQALISHSDESQIEPPNKRSKSDHDHLSSLKLCHKAPSEVLNELLGESTAIKLDEIKRLSNSGPTSGPDMNIDDEKLVLKSFEDKNKRRLFYYCLRHEFPNLKVDIEKKTNDNNRNVIISIDTSYHECLNFLNESETILLFMFIHCHQPIIRLRNCKGPFTESHDITVDDNKEKRTNIHRLIAKYFGSFLESKTKYNMNNRCIINIRRRESKKSRCQPCTASNSQNYCWFVLYKKNYETLHAINRLATQMKLKVSNFSFAGIKDKRAETYQIMSVQNKTVEDLEKFMNTNFKNNDNDLKITSPCNSQRPVNIGELNGNRFCMIVRGLCMESTDGDFVTIVKDAVTRIVSTGFINYYGPQRFGSEFDLVNSCDVGRAILQGNFLNAVELLLSPGGSECQTNKAKEFFHKTKNISDTMKMMPSNATRELLVLKALNRHGMSNEGCAKALCNIPYSMRLLYVHSYCSLVWNKMVSLRFKKYGCVVAPGDLINFTKTLQSDNTEYFTSQANVTIDDVVMPLPGSKIDYPNNEIREWYMKALQEDGITNECFKIKALGINVPGAYRRVIGKAKDLHWNLMGESICSCGLQCSLPQKETTNNFLEKDKSTDQLGGNLKIEFSLSPSNYATVCLREILNL